MYNVSCLTFIIIKVQGVLTNVPEFGFTETPLNIFHFILYIMFMIIIMLAGDVYKTGVKNWKLS